MEETELPPSEGPFSSTECSFSNSISPFLKPSQWSHCEERSNLRQGRLLELHCNASNTGTHTSSSVADLEPAAQPPSPTGTKVISGAGLEGL